MKILKIKQPDGTIVNVPLGKGADGKSAYQYAKDGGYTGTEAEFTQLLGNLDNGGSYTETDPTVPDWAKKSTKPTYTAAEVGALPSTTKIPSKVSDLTNDSGFITSAPVTSVNNKTGAITLSASDVGALPNTTTIPTKLSDLAGDSTHRVVTDTEKSTWNAKANTSAIPTKVSQLTNDSGFITGYTETDPTVPSWAKASTKPSYTKSEVGLGNVDNVKQYSASNPPPYPVTKVNNKTGAVTLSASDVGADASGTAKTAVSTHDVDTIAHADIRAQISKLSSEKVDKNDEDYKNELIVSVMEAIGTPLFGLVESDNTIVLTGKLPDGSYNIRYEMEDGSTVNIGSLVLDTNVYYTVTKNLSNCSISNSATQAIGGQPYSATITANDGYELKSVTVTMGGSPATVTNGVISIASVTGNIVITAVAEEAVVAGPTNFADPESGDWKVDCRLTTNINMTTALTGGVATNYISVQNGDIVTCEGINFENDGNRIAHSDGANGEAIGGIARASVYATTYVNSGFFKDVTYDANSITLTVTCPTTTMRFSGLATGTSNDVVVNIKRNGEWL